MNAQTTTHFTTTNLAQIAVFSALWVILNLTVAPLGFALTHLPVIHSAIIFVILVLAVWATSKFGAASLVSVIGSAIVLLLGGPLPVVGFIPAALLFDAIFLANRHMVNLKLLNLAVAVLASVACAFVAAIVNGLLILNLQLMFVLTVWSGWNVLGAVIGVLLTLPVIVVLEKANVRKVKA